MRWRLVVTKLLSLVPVLFAVSLMTYLLLSLLPGDPALQILGTEGASEESLRTVRADLGLDDPLPIRYLGWLGDALTGDLGRSYQSNQEVVDVIAERLPVTVELVLLSVVFGVVLAILLGVSSAYRAGSRYDKTVTAVTFGLLAVPGFVLALVLIFVFAVAYQVFPATGWVPFTVDPLANLRSAFLPALSLAVTGVAVQTRLVRTEMITTLQEDYVTLARSKGLPTWRILFRHALRPSSFSLITVVGLEIGGLLGGAVVIEEIFALPGLGRLLFQSIAGRDLMVVQGAVLVAAVGFVVVNFVVDVLYSFLDPRIRLEGRRARA